MAVNSRVNTVQFYFDKKFKTPSALEIHKLIFEELKLEQKNVKKIEFDSVGNTLFIKLASAILCEKLARECNGILKFRHIDGEMSNVSVVIVGYGIRKIKVHDLAFEVPDEEISKSLSIYGSVLKITRDKWPETYHFPVENGVRTVTINLRKHIPSYKRICGYRAFILYRGQPPTCSICDAEDHFRKQCPRKPIVHFITVDSDILNFELEFPALPVKHPWMCDSEPERCDSSADVATRQAKQPSVKKRRNAKGAPK